MDNMVDIEEVENSSDSAKRLGPCEVCASSEAKYTCPRCEVKTCCLACVNIHKKELECDGSRNKIFYKRKSKFNNLDLLSDYRLLEDFTRSVQEIQNNPLKRVSRFLPGHLHSLGKASRDRGIRLHFLPRNFKRAKENTSRVIPGNPTRTVFWCIEWLFPQAGVRIVSEKVIETCRLAEALSPLLNPESEKVKDHQEQLQYYFAAGMSGVHALLRVGEMERNRYHILDLDMTIRGNLMKKSIVEFPTILIVLKDHKYSYDIYDSDGETEQWKGNWEASNANAHPGNPSTSGSSSLARKQKNPANRNNFLFGGSDGSSDEEH